MTSPNISRILRGKFVALVVFLATVNLTFGQVKINEICAANGDIIYDPDFFNFPAWVELYNESDNAVDVGGYYLSDTQANTTLWSIPVNTSIPAKGYLIIWCDGEHVNLHTPFSLDADGEEVILADASGTVIDQIPYPEQPTTNISYGRTTDGGSVIDYLVRPTPGVANVNETGAVVLQTPAMSMKAGRYTGPITITVSHPSAIATLRYSVDGSQPDESSPTYAGAIEISATTTVKVRAFAPGYLPSKTEVKTFFINEHEFSLKAISVSIDPAYLNDETIGIYVAGSNGATGRGSTVPVNWNQPWWRHGDIEFFRKDGEKLHDKSVDIQIAGNYSRLKPQKSFEIKSRDKYGKSFFTDKLFPNKKHIEKVKGFYLRNSGTEWNITHFRDGLTQYSTFGRMDLDFQDYEPYIVYLNGSYWGILNLREKNSENFIESNYNLVEGEFDMLENKGRVISGSFERYGTYLDSLINDVNLEDPSSITFLERYIDVQNFINYNTTNIFYSCTDWPHNNVKYWAPKNGRFRWFLYDMDYSMNHGTATSTPTYPALSVVTDPDHPRGEWVTDHLRNALRNPIFKKRFISTMMTALETTFTNERLQPIVTQFQDRIKTEMPYHMEKWDGSVRQWENRVQLMRDFVEPRIAFLRQHYQDFFGLDSPVKLSVKLTPESGGRFELNGQTHSGSLTNTSYFEGLPVSFKASPKPGYRFKHLKISRRGHEPFVLIDEHAEWSYNDQGILPADNWMSISYNDDAWPKGESQLGYGEGDENTVVGFGPSSTQKYLATYFRKEFQVDLSTVGEMVGSVMFDDGAIVYVNGTEVARFQLPAGTITNTTAATTSAENTWRTFYIEKDLLVNGVNVIAVSVHQSQPSSTDMSFDFRLKMERLKDMEEFTNADASCNDVAYSDFSIEAVFEQINGIVINEVSASNTLVNDEAGEADDWIELHNTSSNPVDISGFFVTDDLSNMSKFQIPSGSGGTIMQPGSYLLLWADEQTSQGPTHLNFKLSQEGETLGLFIKEGDQFTALDEVTFGDQATNQSWSRSPNGYGPFALTDHTTPAKENLTIVGIDGQEQWFSAYPNPTDGMINVSFNSIANRITVFDVYGRTIHGEFIDGSSTVLDLRGVERGIYLIRVQQPGRSSFLRIVKK